MSTAHRTGDDHARALVRDRMARVCADLDDLMAIVPADAVRAVLELARTAQGGPEYERAVAAALDELEESVRRAGVAGWSTHRGPRPDAVPGLGDGRAIEEVCVCPRELCARVELPGAEPGRDPLCRVDESRMPRIRLDR